MLNDDTWNMADEDVGYIYHCEWLDFLIRSTHSNSIMFPVADDEDDDDEVVQSQSTMALPRRAGISEAASDESQSGEKV